MILRKWIGVAAILVCCRSAAAQDLACGLLDLSGCSERAAATPGADPVIVASLALLVADPAGAARDVLEDPETLNSLVRSLAGIPNLSVQFKTFQSDAGNALGLTYEYKWDAMRADHPVIGTIHSGYRVALDARGQLSFDPDIQPRDFLETKLSTHFYRSSGGAIETSEEFARALDRAIMELAELSTEELNSSNLDRLTLDAFRNHLTPQIYLDFALNGSLETDQGFDNSQLVGGAQFAVDIKDWSRRTALARMNVFDWPFAILRVLSGVDEELSPRGNIPTVLFGLNAVNPTENVERERLGAMEYYWRLSFETSFKTLFAESAGMPLFAEANFRYYRELGASVAVRDAGLDEFLYFTTAITAGNGMYAGFSTGRLPFDTRSDQVYEVGFSYSF